jgi:hypothetical protein
MFLDYNEDQAMFANVLAQMLAAPATAFRHMPDWQRFDYGEGLDKILIDNGFFDAAGEETLGPVAAANMVHEIAKMPVVVESAASALLHPFLDTDMPRPLSVVMGQGKAASNMVRFLPQARSVLRICDDRVDYAALPDGPARDDLITPVDSLYAYPMGRLAADRVDWRPLNVNPDELRILWRVALAAELTGVLQGGLDAVLTYVREREQFGQPLGAFQAIQHRLATAAVRIDGAKWQMLRAAQSRNDADSALALGTAQSCATQIGYDLHQFMGAMGLTLEHPLHRWTYRARLLRSELGGASRAFRAYADTRWGAVDA